MKKKYKHSPELLKKPKPITKSTGITTNVSVDVKGGKIVGIGIANGPDIDTDKIIGKPWKGKENLIELLKIAKEKNDIENHEFLDVEL